MTEHFYCPREHPSLKPAEVSPVIEAGAYLKLYFQPHTGLPELPGLPLTIYFALYKKEFIHWGFVGWLVWVFFYWAFFWLLGFLFVFLFVCLFLFCFGVGFFVYFLARP